MDLQRGVPVPRKGMRKQKVFNLIVFSSFDKSLYWHINDVGVQRWHMDLPLFLFTFELTRKITWESTSNVKEKETYEEPDAVGGCICPVGPQNVDP